MAFKLTCIFIMYAQAFSLKDLSAPIFPTVLACCVRKAASTVFHPTLSLSRSLRQAKILFLPIKNAKKDRTSFTAMYFEERQ